MKGNFQYLKGLKLADYPPGSQTELEVDVLLGSDLIWRTMMGKIIQGEENEPVAIGTKFGWVLSGPVIYYLFNILKTFTNKCRTPS